MLISVDTEASGPCPFMGDVISIGAVVVEPSLSRTFRSAMMRPRFDAFSQGAYQSINMTREQHLAAPSTYEEVFNSFADWLATLEGKPVMISDNPAFDWQWINYGFHTVLGKNPMGHSARRIGDMWAGLQQKQNDHSSWKRFRKTKHTHDPLDDAMGNAEAILTIWSK